MYKAFLLVAAAIWGLGTVVIKSTVDEFPPAWLVGVRFTVAGIILGIVMLPRFRKALHPRPPEKGAIPRVPVPLVLGELHGLTDTTASNSAFPTSLYCVIIPFLGWRCVAAPDSLQHRRRPRVRGRRGCVSFAGFPVLAALRRPDHAAVGVLSQPACAVHGEVRARSRYDAAHGRAVPGGRRSGLRRRACVRAHARVRQLGAGHVGEPGVLGRVRLVHRAAAAELRRRARRPRARIAVPGNRVESSATFSVLFLGEILTYSLFAGFALISPAS